MAGEKCLTPVERLGELYFDRMLRDIESLRDFAVGEIFEFAKHEDFAATRGQFRDGRSQEIGLLLPTGIFGSIRRIVEDAQPVGFRYRKSLCRGPAAQEVSRGVARRRKQQTPGRHDGPTFPGPKQAHVGLLHDVIGIN